MYPGFLLHQTDLDIEILAFEYMYISDYPSRYPSGIM